MIAMRDGLIGSYVTVAPDAISAYSTSSLKDGDVGRVVLIEIHEERPPVLWVVCGDMHFRFISLNRAKLLSSKELSNMNIRF
jgi:hypothetical protein